MCVSHFASNPRTQTRTSGLRMSTRRSDRYELLIQGYVTMITQKVMDRKLMVPQDIIVLLFNFYYIAFPSLILNDDQDANDSFDLLSQQIPNQRLENATILFRASRDDSSENIWFDKLTNKGPYLFIIQSGDGYIFGGYCSINIGKGNSNIWLHDDKAFVYVLKGAKPKQAIYKVKPNMVKDAILYNGAGFQFIFGPGYGPIHLYKSLIKTIWSHYCMCSNHTYSIPPKETLVGTYRTYCFNMTDMEIFHV